MSTHAVPHIDCDQLHTSLPVSDVLVAADFYTKRLGFTTAFTWGDPPSMAGVILDQVQIFLEKGIPNPEGCSVFFTVGDVDELFAFHRANGVEVLELPGDRHYGLRDYRIRDLHGYVLGFGQRLPAGLAEGPPLAIERVDVPVRIEKRLAALLEDLALYKRMSVSSCLEEILLHTCEPIGEGVASPHSKGQLRHIQELKRKHGIEYDSHASYRFVEK